LSELRVLSMGNNYIEGPLPRTLGYLKHLQRIVLHQNKLKGVVPTELSSLSCIVNLAGNAGLMHGPDVPSKERLALLDLFEYTAGPGWICKSGTIIERKIIICDEISMHMKLSGWGSQQHVALWYKVGVLGSHVHSIVMSSNNMVGALPESLSDLSQLKMIELATMPGMMTSFSR
jgi:hypothetical protein